MLVLMVAVYISIHALLAESDKVGRSELYSVPISIHALLAESDNSVCMAFISVFVFLSTLSLRRATPIRCRITAIL